MYNVHDITRRFEEVLCEYTGAPYAVAVDNCSNALFLALLWHKFNNIHSPDVYIPNRTYMSVPCSIIYAGFNVKFIQTEGDSITGAYRLYPTPVWDYALRFTSNMYNKEEIQCLSFTGPKKHLKLGKGGAILTDNETAYKWFKRMRFSGRREISYHEDDFDMIGYNFYMMPEIAARGLLLMTEFPERNQDLTIKYPDLSKYKVYTNGRNI